MKKTQATIESRFDLEIARRMTRFLLRSIAKAHNPWGVQLVNAGGKSLLGEENRISRRDTWFKMKACLMY